MMLYKCGVMYMLYMWLCTSCEGGVVYMWCCVHVVHVALFTCGILYMLYVVLCICNTVLWVLCSRCVVTCVFIVFYSVLYIRCRCMCCVVHWM